ncbi:MAG: phage baseplate assembly protein V [Hydrogenophaga sp.]|uniref:phage baseplate assembly protein V n=1 Tax=Hydrogenophaga sp. TaxID=1904254 RepID=UPI00271EC4E3|nr:phage baseplate assembly protein V [Hydrogenophaga sp.]MDO9571176.1 phage baseplate assembly protein V [Hydrogenophaga sp.]
MSNNPELTLNELLRRLENAIRPGTIAEVDHTAARVRVQSGELLTDWRPWFETRAGNVRTWCPPSVGEQCLVLSPGGDMAAGWVLVGAPSTANPTPSSSPNVHRTLYPDGTVIDYDHAAHSLDIVLTAGSAAGITADSITLHGAVAVIGPSLTHNGINVGSTHAHSGTTPGPANTGGPA